MARPACFSFIFVFSVFGIVRRPLARRYQHMSHAFGNTSIAGQEKRERYLQLFLSSRTLAHVGPCRVVAKRALRWPINEKTPTRWQRRAKGGSSGGLLAASDETTTFDLLESSIVSFGDVAKDRAVKRGVRRLAAWALPIAFGFHRFDHFLGVHRFAGFAEHHGSAAATQLILPSGFGVGRWFSFSCSVIVSDLASGTSTTVTISFS